MCKPLKACIDAVLARRGQFFTNVQIAEATGLDKGEVYRPLQRLVREGHVKRYHATDDTPTFKKGRPALGDVVYKALPSLKERAANGRDKKLPNAAWDRIWKAIRVLKRFKKKDLVVTSGAKEDNTVFFMKALSRAGIIRATKKGPSAEWRLIDDIGPERPAWGELKRRGDERNR